MSESYVVPDYAGGCISNVVPAILEWNASPSWMPAVVAGADQVVLLVLDGLGWDQLEERRELCPNLAAMSGGSITSIAPSTTAAALTSIVTGLTPGEHGVVGYRICLDHDIVNMLRWTDARGDCRSAHPPRDVQPNAPFCGHRPPVVTKAEFSTTGFTLAHLDGVRFYGYRMASSLVTQVDQLVRAGEPFIYAYYEGIDKVAHEYGLSEFYEAELAAADRIVGDLMARLPAGAVLVVTADHGQLETGDNIVEPHAKVLSHTAMQSGEGRFRWFHARPGRAGALLEALQEHHSTQAWVRTRDEAIKEGWFGAYVSEEASARLGDVCLAAQGTVAFHDPADSGPYRLVGRHGSLTSAEMLVPLLAARA